MWTPSRPGSSSSSKTSRCGVCNCASARLQLPGRTLRASHAAARESLPLRIDMLAYRYTAQVHHHAGMFLSVSASSCRPSSHFHQLLQVDGGPQCQDGRRRRLSGGSGSPWRRYHVVRHGVGAAGGGGGRRWRGHGPGRRHLGGDAHVRPGGTALAGHGEAHANRQFRIPCSSPLTESVRSHCRTRGHPAVVTGLCQRKTSL